ncbi:MAG: phosphatidylethanolamine N-methyltransferase [Halothiobacillus sp. 14-55-98]|jgi:ubiquinone/menaquinone biosynthesis C-methylase UbiE|nr:MAG: phosphatidylethanolamine N-methyltransferase [Halothiobacillus sp. 14-55-98]
MSLRQTYRLWAPIYDLMLKQATRAARSRNLEELGAIEGKSLAIIGIGSGLDLDLFNERTRPEYCVGLDITRAMLKRAQARGAASSFPVRLIEADAMNTPLRSQQFDVVLLHLILAVVPKPERALAEASRILKPGGRIVIFDKFLHHHQKAPLRRLISPLLGMLATRTDVELEPLLSAHPELTLTRNESLLARSWFRGITLIKNA